MLNITYKKYGIKLTHIWFATDEDIKNNNYLNNCGDLIFFHGSFSSITPKNAKILNIQHTLVKDLEPSEEEILQSFGKKLRAEIRKNIKNDEVKIIYYTSEDLLKNIELLITCKKLFEKMFSDKKMNVKFNLNLAKCYCKKNILLIAITYIDNKPVGFKSLIYDTSYARPWVTAFDFRNESLDSRLISGAHKRIEYELLCWCKNKGIKWFDYGGVNSFDNPNGIAQFKMQFESNNKITYKNYLIPNSLVGKIALNIFLKKGL